MYASFYNSTPLPYNQNHHNFFTLLILETIRLTIFPLYHFPKQYHRPVSTMGLFSITFPSLSIIDSNEITSLNNVRIGNYSTWINIRSVPSPPIPLASPRASAATILYEHSPHHTIVLTKKVARLCFSV